MHIDSYMINSLTTNLIVADMYTVYCKSFKVENFCGVEVNCNSLDNVHGYMVVLCGQTLLHRGIIATVPNRSAKTQNFSTLNNLSICDRASKKGSSWHKIHHVIMLQIF